MFRKFLVTSALLLAIFSIKAQDEKAQDGKLRVAVFDPTSSSVAIDEGTRDAVRELISTAFVNTGKYSIVERSLLQQVMKEQKISNTDAFDESQATELGRLAGANKVVLSVVSLVGGRNMLSIKLIDVKTATIDLQKIKIVNSNDLLDVVEPLTLELLGEPVSYPQPQKPSNNVSNTEPIDMSSKYTQGKEITFTCKSFPSFFGKGIEGEVKVFFDDDLIWSGGTEGFTIKMKDPNPGTHLFKVVVDAYKLQKDGQKQELPIIGGSGGTFDINTLSKDFYEFTTSIWNFKVKLKK